MTLFQFLIVVYLILLLMFLLYGIHIFVKDKLLYHLPPGPLPLPFIGTGYCLSSDMKCKPWKTYGELASRYGNTYTFYFGQVRAVFLHGAANIRNALVLRSKQFSCRSDSFLPGFNSYSHGVFSSDGETWVNLRKFCMSGLRQFGLGTSAMQLKIQEEASELVSELDKRTSGVETSIDLAIQNAVFNIVCCLIFGDRFDYGHEKFVELRKLSQILFERPFKENVIYFALPIVAKIDVPPQPHDVIKVGAHIRSWLAEAIEERKRLTNHQELCGDFIDLYMAPGQELINFETFVAVVRDLFLAGTETTASSLTWAILYLCKFPEVQQKCHDEIDSVITSQRMPTTDDRPQLTYVDAFMTEIQRHVTIVPHAVFHGIKDEGVVFDGYSIPPNTAVIYNIWALHHDIDYWKDPETFRPERWIDNGKLLEHESHFMPFGIGPRKCLGEVLARQEYFIYIVAMLQRFSFSFPDGDYDVDMDSGRCCITNVPPKFDVSVRRRQGLV